MKLFFYKHVALECSELIIEQTPRNSWEFLVLLQYMYDVIYVDLTVMFQSSGLKQKQNRKNTKNFNFNLNLKEKKHIA